MVTGAACGLGRATALRLAEDGYAVVLCGDDGAEATETRQLIEWSGGRARQLIADFRDAAALHALIAATTDVLDGTPLDVLVNNTCAMGCAETTEALFDTAFDLIVKAPHILTSAFAPTMADRGGGTIVNVTTGAGTIAAQAAKVALNALTTSWAAEYGPRGVRVNSVDAGAARHIETPDAIAEAIRFLVSHRASAIHGAVLTISGANNAAELRA
ncbi:SDR family NAD(P)-dependent oxidoreductase [Nocardia altamirensis]|uniref:SDR family NAD(P)-dependent oxidoreductase n=1 Tax=Nocardia altamirensis TaxID=472158 RepID=UPI001FE0E14B|nr:SDR family oxidoreductase [Nocardia altamirensis]